MNCIEPSMPTSEPLDRLRTLFKECFKIDLPNELVCKGLQDAVDSALISTHPDDVLPLLIGPKQTFSEDFSVPLGHHTVGFWGHGVNSYAFYAIFQNSNESVYLRLHRGGAYTGPVKMASDIASYILALTQLLRTTRTANGQLLVIESMGTGLYRYQIDGTQSEIAESLLGRRDIGDALVALIDPEVRAQRQALALENVVVRDKALNIASDIYHVEMCRSGNERVGMRAMGAAKDRIRDVSLTLRSQEYQHEILSALEALKERHLDIDGEHEHARSCIDQLLYKLK